MWQPVFTADPSMGLMRLGGEPQRERELALPLVPRARHVQVTSRAAWAPGGGRVQGKAPRCRVLPGRGPPLMGGTRHAVPLPSVPTRPLPVVRCLPRVCAQRGLSSSCGHPDSAARVTRAVCGTPGRHTPWWEGWGLGLPSPPGRWAMWPSLPLRALSATQVPPRLPPGPSSWSVTPWARTCVQGLDSMCAPACTPPASARPPAGSEPQD